MSKVAVVYWSGTGNTEAMAKAVEEGIKNAGSEAVAAASDVLNAKLQEVVAKTAVDLYINDPEATTDEGKPVRIIRRAETNLGDLCAAAASAYS